MDKDLEYKIEFATENSSVEYPELVVRKYLEAFSTRDLVKWQNRTNFHLTHYMILSRKRKESSLDSEINTLKTLSSILEAEIEYRLQAI